ncbi:MAG: DUF1559 domain-containing protein [Planctomycetaceae bacterium]|nr:DUF1559 domain-containing protein [Planctomycetaceae bacterium]
MNKPERPVNTFYGFCSLILPGLGQLLQRRFGTAIGFFVLFLVSGFLPLLIISLLFMDRFSYQPLRVHLLHIGVFAGLFYLFMVTIFWSAIDATGTPKEKPEVKQEEEGEKPEEKKKGCSSGCIILIAVIIVVGFVVALLLPAVPSAREAARHMQCTNNIKQIALALHSYHDDYKSFPPAYTVDENGKPLHSWRVLILPYIEQTALYEKIRLDEPWDSEYNRQFHAEAPGDFQCPSRGATGAIQRERPELTTGGNCFYSVVLGPETPFTGEKPVRLNDIWDGTSNTICIVERLLPVCWMDPNNEIRFNTACEGIDRKQEGIGSNHSGGANAALVDGSVTFLSDTIKPEILKAMLTKAGGENVVTP